MSHKKEAKKEQRERGRKILRLTISRKHARSMDAKCSCFYRRTHVADAPCTRRFGLATSRRRSVPRGVDARVCEASQRSWESLQIIPRRVLAIGESVSRSDKKYPAARFERCSRKASRRRVVGRHCRFCAIHCLPSSATVKRLSLFLLLNLSLKSTRHAPVEKARTID